MKKQSIKFAALLCAAMMLFVGCDEFKPAVNEVASADNGTAEADSTVVTDADGNVDENPFTVTMMFEGKPYIPASNRPISVRWSDGYSLHEAPIGSDGIARVGGLDGDYRITLTDVPEGYTYNPNIYTATNGHRNIDIELHRIQETKGIGNEPYNSIPLRYTGVYCVELKNADQEVFFEFGPKESGTYAVETWLDITANDINPYANYYGANVAFKTYRYTQDDGGAASTYTKNFKLTVEIADENISDNGAAAFTFGIKATSKSNTYPAKVYFAITLNGDFELNHAKGKIMLPEAGLKFQQDYDSSEYEFVGAEVLQKQNGNSAYVFDSDRYKLWPADEGGDDYYHVWEPENPAYAATKGYGPILYAEITKNCRFLGEGDQSFATVEYAGNKALTVSNGTENYKLFIEGYAALNTYTLSPTNPNGKPPYFCTLECPCRVEGTNDSMEITGNPGACFDGCETCSPDCNTLPEGGIGQKGYADYVNSDGCYAVTEELKDFLQKYSVNQLLFFDGNGFVETHPARSVYAEEDDQWLFACGYYMPRA